MRWEKEGQLFCFPFNCIWSDTLTCIISSSQEKKDFLLLLFKNKISRESMRAFSSFHSKQCLHSKREDEKREQLFSSAGEGHFSF